MPGQRWLGVALARARQPPAADLDRPRRPAHVDDAVELIVAPVARREVGRARAAVDVLAVHPPQVMHAARGRARRLEARQDGGRGGGRCASFELSWRAHATAKHDGGVEACQTTTNEPTAVLAPTLTFASASGGLPTSMIPSAVHPQDLSRDLLTERSWGTSREGGITDDIKAETEPGPRAFPSAHSTLSPAGLLGDA